MCLPILEVQMRNGVTHLKPNQNNISVISAHFISGLQFIPDVIKLTTKKIHHRGKTDWGGRQDMIEEGNNIHV